MNPLREELEYLVREAAERERVAWSELEQASRPDEADEAALTDLRDRWQSASHSLVAALRALKR